LTACGPTFEESHPVAESCEPRTPTTDPIQNCTLYCDVYLCLDCPETAEQCRLACVGNVTQANPDPCLPPVLECAVQHVHEPGIVGSLSCSDDHTQVFKITLSPVCSAC
jgi:hypothetical protein